MSPTFTCPQCGATALLPDELIQRAQRCPTCGIGPDAAASLRDPSARRKILGMSVPLFVAVATALLLCAGVPLVLFPMIAGDRSHGHPIRSKSRMHDLGISIHNYASDHEGLLPTSAKIDADKKPLLSWRVHVLIYVEGKNLYDQFHLDEPWDSEHNSKLIERMPAIYRSPTSNVADEGKTVYLAVTGPDTAFENGRKILHDVPDGATNTIMLVEVSDRRAVIWTKPDDWEFDPERPMDGLMGQRDDGFLVMAMDTRVHLIQPDFDRETFKRLVLRNDGKPAGFDD